MAELRFPVPPLADDVVLLRPWREADVPGKLLAFGDPVMQRFSWRTTPYTEADARDDFADQEAARLRGEELNFALAEPHDRDAVLGDVSLYEVRLAQARAAIGYWLAPEARGRGAATHAVRLLARWAFAELGLARLELTCSPGNEASQRVAERCGFTREGLLRSHVPFQGTRRDSVIYSLLPGELRLPEQSWHKPGSGRVFRGQGGGRGIRTHGDIAATMVFKRMRDPLLLPELSACLPATQPKIIP